MTTTAMIGMGANLGDPVQQIVDARAALHALPSSCVVTMSSLYLSSPVGYSEQANFINCVLELRTQLDAYALLEAMHSIESALGRLRVVGNQNAPRSIDLDLLLFGDQHINSEDLQVPHPRMHQRLFVLQPLYELNADISLPEYGRVADLMTQAEKFSGQLLDRLAL